MIHVYSVTVALTELIGYRMLSEQILQTSCNKILTFDSDITSDPEIEDVIKKKVTVNPCATICGVY